MYPLVRAATITYALAVFIGGYLAVSTLKTLWTTAGQIDQLAAISASGADAASHTLLVFDEIQPSAGAK